MSEAKVFDQYSRWLCPKCGEVGFDSWNKAVYDGIAWEDDDNVPLPHIMGLECEECCWPAVVRYDAPSLPPVAIFGPVGFEAGAGCYGYESAAMAAIEADRANGTALIDGGPTARDKDWRGGCRSLTEPPAL